MSPVVAGPVAVGPVTAGAGSSGVGTGTLRDMGQGRFELAGAITMTTVTALRGAGLKAFAASGSDALEVSLQAVERADSGALALLIDWLAWASAAGKSLNYTALPGQLLALARLSDVENLVSQGVSHGVSA